jgi:hypothetical protein
MKNSKLYFYLSIAGIVLNFITGVGMIISIILLVLIPSEKNKILEHFDGSNEDEAEELSDLSSAKTLSIINIVLSVVIYLVVFALLLFFGIGLFSSGGNFSRWS